MKGIILDLCGGTGSWSRPWEAAGYDVRILTLPKYDVTRIRKEFVQGVPFLRLENEITGRYEYIPVEKVRGILAAPPCTEFSVLNCKAEARERKPAEGLVVVMACLNVIRMCDPDWWAMENPVGYLREYMGAPQLTFQPWEYGDPWTKRTDIWGEFNPPAKRYKTWEDVSGGSGRMRKTTCICDRCGKEIAEGVVYTLTCYAEDVNSKAIGASLETAHQNMTQNMRRVAGEKELCRECKDELTDGLFIV